MRYSFTPASTGVAAILAALVAASTAGAQGQGAPTFKPGALPSEGNTQYLMSVSSDKKAGAIIFDGLEKQLDGMGAPLLATRVFSISMPLTGAEKGVKLGFMGSRNTGFALARRAWPFIADHHACCVFED
jgi:hypothetical protein